MQPSRPLRPGQPKPAQGPAGAPLTLAAAPDPHLSLSSPSPPSRRQRSPSPRSSPSPPLRPISRSIPHAGAPRPIPIIAVVPRPPGTAARRALLLLPLLPRSALAEEESQAGAPLASSASSPARTAMAPPASLVHPRPAAVAFLACRPRLIRLAVAAPLDLLRLAPLSLLRPCPSSASPLFPAAASEQLRRSSSPSATISGHGAALLLLARPSSSLLHSFSAPRATRPSRLLFPDVAAS